MDEAIIKSNNDDDEQIDQDWKLLLEFASVLREEEDVEMLINYSLTRTS